LSGLEKWEGGLSTYAIAWLIYLAYLFQLTLIGDFSCQMPLSLAVFGSID
jgi:hypothetical protein